jgi:hypothetical protein
MHRTRILIAAVAILGLPLLCAAQPESPTKGAAPVLDALKQPVRKHYVYDGAAHDVPPTWGTSEVSFSRLGATELAPDGSSTTYTSTWFPPGVTNYQRWVMGGYPHLIGYGHVPGGSLLVQTDENFCETNTSGPYGTISFYFCDALGNCPSSPFFSWDMGTFGAGCQSVGTFYGSGAATVNNADGLILVDVAFAHTDGSESIGSIGFGYKLQVSPAPGSPTFGDVPLSDPAFQYIEALVASGITAGCGGGNYCPDAPLTRRQMAVFIAKALGLDWPNY